MRSGSWSTTRRVQRARLALAVGGRPGAAQRPRGARHRARPSRCDPRRERHARHHDLPPDHPPDRRRRQRASARPRRSRVGGTLIGVFIGIVARPRARGRGRLVPDDSPAIRTSRRRRRSRRAKAAREPREGREGRAGGRRQAALRLLQDPARRRRAEGAGEGRRTSRGPRDAGAGEGPAASPGATRRRRQPDKPSPGPTSARDQAAERCRRGEARRALLAAGGIVRRRGRRREPEGAARARRLGGGRAAGDAARQGRCATACGSGPTTTPTS